MTEKPTYEELTQELQALKKNVSEKNYLEDIYHSIGQSVLLLDQDQNILSVNRFTEKITGLSANELKGKKCYQVFHGPEINSPPESCPLQKLLTTGNVEVEEMEVETLGSTFLISCTPIFDNNSKLKRVIHIATDITEKKAIESQIHQLKILANRELKVKIKERKQAEEINKTLFAILSAVNTTQNLEDLFVSIHHTLGNIIDVTNFFIAMVDIKKRTLYFPYHVDTTDDDFSPITNFDTNNSLTGLVVS
jgi:PAS domain S-box-containing protein